jgi:hypothetical protein
MFRIVLVAAATILGASARYLLPGEVLWPAALVVAGVSAAIWLGADHWVRRRPVLATWLYQGGYLAVFALIAGSAALATWLAILVPGLVGQLPQAGGAPTSETEALTGVILGAMGTLVGAAWLDSAQKPDGTFWPEARQRAALLAAFRHEAKLKSPPGGSRGPEMEQLYAAVFDDPDSDYAIDGWSLEARLQRARVIARLDRT